MAINQEGETKNFVGNIVPPLKYDPLKLNEKENSCIFHHYSTKHHSPHRFLLGSLWFSPVPSVSRVSRYSVTHRKHERFNSPGWLPQRKKTKEREKFQKILHPAAMGGGATPG